MKNKIEHLKELLKKTEMTKHEEEKLLKKLKSLLSKKDYETIVAIINMVLTMELLQRGLFCNIYH